MEHPFLREDLNAWDIAELFAEMRAFRKDLIGVRAAFEIDMLECGATVESTSGEMAERQRQMDAFQLRTAVKGLVADDFHTVGDLDIAKPLATEKGTVVDLAQCGGKLHTIEIFTFEKYVSADGANGIRHKDLRQMVA